nr:hypothetical protein Iba_chr01cCG16580 [Ipomoea batatas]
MMGGRITSFFLQVGDFFPVKASVSGDSRRLRFYNQNSADRAEFTSKIAEKKQAKHEKKMLNNGSEPELKKIEYLFGRKEGDINEKKSPSAADVASQSTGSSSPQSTPLASVSKRLQQHIADQASRSRPPLTEQTSHFRRRRNKDRPAAAASRRSFPSLPPLPTPATELDATTSQQQSEQT